MEGVHWRHQANAIEQSMCGGDAALLSNYFDHLLLFTVSYLTEPHRLAQPGYPLWAG